MAKRASRKASRRATKKAGKKAKPRSAKKKARKNAPAKRATSKSAGGSIIPAMRYRDPNKAVEFLCQAFGFKEKAVYRGESGGVEHAELTLGNGMIMLGPVRDTEFSKLMKQPDEAGGETQTAYIVVKDVDAHHARAKAAGIEIVIDIKDEDYGGRDYTCRDPEGHIWTFGSYDPWQAQK